MSNELQFVHILHVRHRNGDNYYAHLTKEGAELAIAEFVHDSWKDEMPDHIDMPDTTAESIALYFDTTGQFYAIEPSAVLA